MFAMILFARGFSFIFSSLQIFLMTILGEKQTSLAHKLTTIKYNYMATNKCARHLKNWMKFHGTHIPHVWNNWKVNCMAPTNGATESFSICHLFIVRVVKCSAFVRFWFFFRIFCSTIFSIFFSQQFYANLLMKIVDVACTCSLIWNVLPPARH